MVRQDEARTSIDQPIDVGERYSRGFHERRVVMAGYEKRVLIAEDDEDARGLLSMVLGKEGYSVHTALDAEQALDEMKKRRFDVIIADHHPPKLNGLQLVVLGRLVWPDTPIILLTIMLSSADNPGLAEISGEERPYGCLRKPYDITELLCLMQNAILSARKHRSQISESDSLSACQDESPVGG
jgi:two-component system chemotaxis response regulator CheY